MSLNPKHICLAAITALSFSACTASSDAPDLAETDDPVRVGDSTRDAKPSDASSFTDEGLKRKREVAEQPPLEDLGEENEREREPQ